MSSGSGVTNTPPGGGSRTDGGLDAFISYSHRDDGFALRLRTALERAGRNIWIDADDIPPAAPWRRELGTAIEAADAVVFVISPDSLRSVECHKELARALELGKRLIPVLLRDAEGIPAELAALQFVDARREPDFSGSVASIVEALDTDHEWVREHTHWLARALRWDEHGRDQSYLLRRGGDLQAGERWLARQAEGKKPPPTPLQTEYIVASREAEERRLRALVAASLVAVAVSAGLAIFALVQRGEAIEQRNQARSRELAAGALSQLAVDPELSVLLALEAGDVEETPEAADALRRAIVESRILHTLTGHRDSVGSVAWSGDGSLLATASVDGTARLWDSSSGRQVAVLRGHAGPVRSASFAPDGGLLLTAADDGTARLWRAPGGEQVAALRGHEGRISSAAFSRRGDRVVTAGVDGTVRVWTTTTGAEVAVLRGHRGAIWTATFSPDGRSVLSAGVDTTVRLWDVETRASVPVGRHTQPVFDAIFSPRGGLALVVAVDITTLWNLSSGGRVAELGQAFGASFSADGKRILTTRRNGTARIWETPTGREVAALGGHGGPIVDAAFSSDGTMVLTAGLDQTARVWDARSGASLAVLRGHAGPVYDAAFSKDGAVVATASDDGTARTWELAVPVTLRGHGSFGHRIRGAETSLSSVALSRDGSLVLTAADDGTARLWSTKTGREIVAPGACRPLTPGVSCLARSVLLAHQNFVTSAAFRPDGRQIVTSGEDGTARVWQVSSGEQVSVLRGHSGPVWSAGFDPGGGRAVTAGQDGTVRVWDTVTGRELAALRGHRGAVADAVVNPDGTAVLSAGSDGTLRRWSPQGGASTVVTAQAGTIGGMAVSPNGRFVVAPIKQDATVFDAESGVVLATMHGHDGQVRSASFSEDGALVVTASADGTARIWEAESGREIATFRGHEGALSDAVVSSEHDLVVTAGEDGTARIFACEVCEPLDELRARARRNLTRGLTPAERGRFLEPE